MEIKIVIDAPKGWKRRVLLFVVMPLGLVAATALIARATVQNVDAGWIQAGSQVSATDLSNDFGAVNTNFSSLDQRISALEAFKTQATLDGGYSVGAVYCGATQPIYSGALGGYAGAKALCQAQYGPAAHMCTGEELVRSLATGTQASSLPSGKGGWYSGFMYASYPAAPSNGMFDCNQWTSSANDGNAGPVYSSSSGIGVLTCNTTGLAVLCCQ
jgi:hypothetical protein